MSKLWCQSPLSLENRDGTKLFSRNFFITFWVLTLVKVKCRTFLNCSAHKIHIGQYEEFCYSSLHLQPIKVLWESWVCISQLEFGEFSQKCPHDPGHKENREEGGCHPFWGNVSLVGPKEFGGCSNKRVSCSACAMETTAGWWRKLNSRVFSALFTSLWNCILFSPLRCSSPLIFCSVIPAHSANFFLFYNAGRSQQYSRQHDNVAKKLSHWNITPCKSLHSPTWAKRSSSLRPWSPCWRMTPRSSNQTFANPLKVNSIADMGLGRTETSKMGFFLQPLREDFGRMILWMSDVLSWTSL